MQCPHCQIEFHDHWKNTTQHNDKHNNYVIDTTTCPKCQNLIVRLQRTALFAPNPIEKTILYPRTSSRPPPPPEVPEKFASDYKEAALVLELSPKAAAALARRCLQNLLRDKALVKHGDLASEIEAAKPILPSHVSEALDMVRQVGNLAAHPTKSKSSGEILDVDPGEAESCLIAIDALFDHLFIAPEKLRRQKEEFNNKLKDADKLPMR